MAKKLSNVSATLGKEAPNRVGPMSMRQVRLEGIAVLECEDIITTCPYCRRESHLRVGIERADSYSIRCPHKQCNRHFVRQLPGAIIHGPSPNVLPPLEMEKAFIR